METKELLLLTAFSCFASDGEISKKEIEKLHHILANDYGWDAQQVNEKVNHFSTEIAEKGKKFLREYFKTLGNAAETLAENQELEILKVAAIAILADEQIEYKEVKFFKIIRSHLKVNDEKILENIPQIDMFWLEDDVKMSREEMYQYYFDSAPESIEINECIANGDSKK